VRGEAAVRALDLVDAPETAVHPIQHPLKIAPGLLLVRLRLGAGGDQQQAHDHGGETAMGGVHHVIVPTGPERRCPHARGRKDVSPQPKMIAFPWKIRRAPSFPRARMCSHPLLMERWT
jgi:hypothetical protein